jgi:sulfate transport system ATP-binding protein
MTAGENVAFGLKVRREPKSKIGERVKELFALVQLDGMEGRYPSELSGGQRQRVALARALAVSPRVLLLDEPFGALDAQVRQELRSWLRALHERTRVTTLIVTHDQEEAFELADHVVLLSKGEVAQAGPPTELYDKPANAFVAAFLGGAREISRSVQGAPGERSFVRPTDLRVRKAAPTPSAPVGKVERVVRVGGFAKIWILLDSGDALTVQMTSVELDALGVGIGEAVEVEVRETRTFVNDYSI